MSLLSSFMKDWLVGSVAPTSRFGVRQICSQIDFQKAKMFVEYGAGTGAVSRALLERMLPEGTLVLIEQNPELAEELRSIIDPRVIVVHGSAAQAPEILESLSISGADAVISGIPFSQLPDQLRREIVERTNLILEAGGSFIVYQFRDAVVKELRRVFGQLSKTRVWLNFPPLQVFTARKSSA